MSVVSDVQYRLELGRRMWCYLSFRESIQILEGKVGPRYLESRPQARVELDPAAPAYLLQLRYREQEQEQVEELELFPPLAEFATPARRATLPWQRPRLPVLCRHVRQLQVRLRRLDSLEVNNYYEATENQEDFLLSHWEHTFGLDNPDPHVEVDLSPALPEPHGFVAVELAAEGGWRQSLLLDVSGLGLTYYHLRRNRFLLCTELAQAHPCAGMVFPAGQTDAGGVLANLGQLGSYRVSLSGDEGSPLGRRGELEVAVANGKPPAAEWSRGRYFLVLAHLPESKQMVLAGWLRRQNSPSSPMQSAFASHLEASCWGQPQEHQLGPEGSFRLCWPWQPDALRLSLSAPGPEGDHHRLQFGGKPESFYEEESQASPVPGCRLEMPQAPVEAGQNVTVRLGLEHWPAHVVLGLWRGDLCQLHNRRVDQPWSEWTFPIVAEMEPGVLIRADAFCEQGHFMAQELLPVAWEARQLRLSLSSLGAGLLEVRVQPSAPTQLLVIMEEGGGDSPDPLETFLTPPECWLTLTSNLDRLPGREPPGQPQPSPAAPPPPILTCHYLEFHQTDEHGQARIQLPPAPAGYRLRIHAAAGPDRFGSIVCDLGEGSD